MRHGVQPYAIAAAATVLPRLAALAVERDEILRSFTEKSDDFARTLAASGTFGFLPGEPSAYTQPLYGWFLAALYWTLGREWLVVGLAQTAVAVGTSLLVVAIGTRVANARTGLVAGLVVALHPYLVWHDVHLNREVLDTFLVAARDAGGAVGRAAPNRVVGRGGRRARRGRDPREHAPRAAAARPRRLAPLARRPARARRSRCCCAAVVVVVPWVVRNDVQVGCATITTDAKALWKANNLATHDTLARGGWIDDVPDPPGAPETPEDAARQGRTVDECAQMRLYRDLTVDFWQEHPGEKARLAAQAVGMLWSPRGTRTDEGPGAAGFRGEARAWLLPLFVVPLFALALWGFVLVPRPVAVLFALLLVTMTVNAMVFAGATRYRVPFDPLLGVLAGAAVDRLLRARASR